MVDTIFQLLNAIEAANTFNLSNNHLIIVSVEGPARNAYAPLVEKMQWASVRYLAYKDIYEDIKEIKALGPKTNNFYIKWYSRYEQFMILRRLARLTSSIKDIDNLFLGHYWVEHKFYMRHFANTLKYKTLYLIDDGTDTIDINNRRKRIDLNKKTTLSKSAADGTAILIRLKRYLREKYLDWRTEDAASITFFTSYDLDVRDGDHLIKNEYAYLRSLATAMKRS